MNKPHIVVVGSINMDVVVMSDRVPDQGETVLGDTVRFVPGGKGANQAVAAARMGARVTMLGAVGQDMFGQQLLQSLEQDQIELSAVKTVHHEATGIASIWLANQDNRIIVVPGANACLKPEDIAANESVIRQADIVLLQLEIPLDTVREAARIARRHNVPVVLNPAPAAYLPDDLLCNVDIMTPNRTELSLLTEMDVDMAKMQEAMAMLLGKGPKHIVATLGSVGAAWMSQDKLLSKVEAYRVPVVDTTGAGDAFNAGLSYALALGQDLKEAVHFANAVSALAVTKFGAQPSMPTLQEVQAFVASMQTNRNNRDGQ